MYPAAPWYVLLALRASFGFVSRGGIFWREAVFAGLQMTRKIWIFSRSKLVQIYVEPTLTGTYSPVVLTGEYVPVSQFWPSDGTQLTHLAAAAPAPIS